MAIDLLTDPERPRWFVSPHPYARLIDQHLTDLTPWYFLEKPRMLKYADELKRRYGVSRLPFARRQDNDDVACFEEGRGPAVVLIHDGAASGSEVRSQFSDVWGWFRYAVEQMIEWDP
jgi:hypothetical protein